MPCTALSSAVRHGALIALLVAFGAGADRAAAQAVQTRAASCAGFDFHPIDYRTIHQWQDRVRYRAHRDGDGWFMCAAHLPHRAVVTRVRFTLKDQNEHIEVRHCALIRTPLALTGAIQALAVMASTGMAAKPGIVRLSDTSIDFATVNNVNYAYSLQCEINFSASLISIAGAFAGIIGAEITYTISAANG